MTCSNGARFSRRVLTAIGFGALAELAVPVAAQSTQPTTPTPIDDIFAHPFIRIGNITYLLNEDSSRTITVADQDHGLAVHLRLADESTAGIPCAYAENDTAWPFSVTLSVNTMKGYEPSFRLIAWLKDHPSIFEAWCNENAKSGRDLLNVEGKVEWIEIEELGKRPERPISVRDRTTVKKIVDLVLSAPVDKQVDFNVPGPTYLLAFHLQDGRQQFLQITYRPPMCSTMALSCNCRKNSKSLSPKRSRLRSLQRRLHLVRHPTRGLNPT